MKPSIKLVLLAALLLISACSSPTAEAELVPNGGASHIGASVPALSERSADSDEGPIDVAVGVDATDVAPTPSQTVVDVADAAGAGADMTVPSDATTPDADANDGAAASEQANPASEQANPASEQANPASEQAVSTEYTVESGDTLLGIALAHDLPMAAVQLANNMGAGTTIQVGQLLQIPSAYEWPGASPFWVVHEIAAGETVSEIAARYGLDLAELTGVNRSIDPDVVSVGQPLVLPLMSPADVVAKANVSAPTPLPAPTEAPPAPTTTEGDAAVAAASAPTSTPEAQPVAPPPTPTVAAVEIAPPADVSNLASAIFRGINEQRAAHGLPPLTWSPLLAQVAQAHADDCHARGWCSHTGSDGSTYRQRMIRAGYEPVRWSECWAWYGTPERAVAMWMDEVPPNDPHRRTILSDYLTEVGVGVAVANERSYYFIADFGTPK